MIDINTVVTSKDEILRSCREIVSERGLKALNMRSVAQACHVALGSLYNYFPSKDDLVMATIESVWQDIFQMEHSCKNGLPFPNYVSLIFQRVQAAAKDYPNFFTAHSISFASSHKDKAKETMQHYFSHMKLGMAEALRQDCAVSRTAFSAQLTEEDLIDFVFSNILALLVQQKSDCGVLLAVIRRTIYAA